MNGTTTSLSVVVPVYNSAGTLSKLVQRIHAAMTSEFSHYEIILVDDGSRDNSWPVMDEIARSNDRVTSLRMARNYGQHAALLAGLRHASCDLLVTMDDDLQNPPEEIQKLYDCLREGNYDLVYGKRATERHGFVRNSLSRVTKWTLASAMSTEVAKSVTAFRILRKSLIDDLREVDPADVLLDVMLSWVTSNIGAVEVRHDKRVEGHSNYSTRTLARHAISMITGYSTLPLRISTIVGFAFTAFGALALVYVIALYFLVGSVAPGFPFLASLVAIFSGVQLLMLGIFGEYLARLFTRSMGRPTYVVRTWVSLREQPPDPAATAVTRDFPTR